jgi:tetratricopeptide (TPR) repeat protein
VLLGAFGHAGGWGLGLTDHYFVSYSRIDAADDALWLADTLAGGPSRFPVWVDKRDLRPGTDWDEQVAEAIRTCRGLLLILTADSVRPNSMCKREWVRALKYKKPVIPLRFHRDAELPFRLEPREYVDFTRSVEAAVTRLREHLGWMDTPAGVLQALTQRLGDAERELERATEVSERARIEQEIKDLRRQIAVQEQVLEDPQAASQHTQQRIASGLERERVPERPVVVRRAKFINPPPVRAPQWFQDRHVETGLIGDFLRDDALRLLTVVGRGGVGKSAMVCRLLRALEDGKLPDDLGPLAVGGIVYLSPVGAHPVSFPSLFADLSRLLPDDTGKRLEQLYRDPQQTPEALMLAVLEEFPDGRTVVLLDNFEDVVDFHTLAITDAALDAALRTLLTAPQHGIKVICTTRVAPRKLLLVQPAHQQRVNLDEGLPSPYAENILRAMDRDGTLGFKTAPEPLLQTARVRTRGYPRALEALVAILAADRDTTLPELLAEAGKLLPDNVVEALVGEAFNRLDPLAQQVMQALAIYGLPVPAVAVDYLLQPYRVAVDSAPVLGRLVNMQFVRRDAGRYYLHQVDRDYAFGRVPEGEPADREATEPRFTRYGLRHRGAAYFEQTRKPREAWKQLEDLAPQLAEFELRCQGEDYDTAASVLLDFDFDYLLVWGHYRLTVKLHEHLQGKLTDPGLKQASVGNLGSCYAALGETRRAIDLYEQALVIARDLGDRRSEAAHLGRLGNRYADVGETRRAIDLYEQALVIARDLGDRRGEAIHLGNLGLGYAALGETRRAIDLYEQALVIARDLGDRRGEANHLGNLGNCYGDLGETRRAIDYHEQALVIARDLGNRRGEGINLGNLGNCYADLGETRRAIDYHEQALVIARDIGYRRGEAIRLTNLGDCYVDRGAWKEAIQRYGEAIQVADEIGLVQAQREARSGLAEVHLLRGELPAARQTAEAARTYDYPPRNASISAMLGVVLLRQGQTEPARLTFTEAVAQADTLLEYTGDNYQALDSKALALCGLTLLGDTPRLPEADAAAQAARAVNRNAGVVRRVLRLLDALAPADQAGIIAPVRAISAGSNG